MKFTAAHWGAYQFSQGDLDLSPLPTDAAPSRVGQSWVSAMQNPDARIARPVIRKGWLDGDKGRNRCNNDDFVEVSWDVALDYAAEDLKRIQEKFGAKAVYGGSYGWSSAGRFHHAQSQLRRFLALSGGYVSSRDTYSHGAAEVLFPFILGVSCNEVLTQTPPLSQVEQHCDILLAFGGISSRTAQIASSGVTGHDVPAWLDRLQKNSIEVLSITPEKDGALGAWWPIKPGTDTALILALIYEIVKMGAEDRAFLDTYTSGWDVLRRYVLGQSDGIAKTAQWAAKICDLETKDIQELAGRLPQKRVLVNTAWSLQRADHGEQPIWAALALSCVLGQFGSHGGGYAFGYGCTSPIGHDHSVVAWPSLPKIPNPVRDYIPVARIADALLNPHGTYKYNGTVRSYPDLKMVWWTGGNPFHHHQDLQRLERAWCRPETVVVTEHSWTATARRADIVLPATSPLERNDIMVNKRDPRMIYMSAFQKPYGLARNDYDIFADLAERFDQRSAFTLGLDEQGWLQKLWSETSDVALRHDMDLPDFEQFTTQGVVELTGLEARPRSFDGFMSNPTTCPLSTHSGKITLFNDVISEFDLADCSGHPSWMAPREGAQLEAGQFHLISGQPHTRLHSQNDQGSKSLASKFHGRERCALHPETADKLSVVSGDLLRLWNARGATLCAVSLQPDIRRDCISLPTGAWYDPQVVSDAFLEVHGNPNALTLDHGCSELSQGNCAHSCVVWAKKWDHECPDLSIQTAPTVIARTVLES